MPVAFYCRRRFSQLQQQLSMVSAATLVSPSSRFLVQPQICNYYRSLHLIFVLRVARRGPSVFGLRLSVTLVPSFFLAFYLTT